LLEIKRMCWGDAFVRSGTAVYPGAKGLKLYRRKQLLICARESDRLLSSICARRDRGAHSRAPGLRRFDHVETAKCD
jgi:hypothetical protein